MKKNIISFYLSQNYEWIKLLFYNPLLCKGGQNYKNKTTAYMSVLQTIKGTLFDLSIGYSYKIYPQPTPHPSCVCDAIHLLPQGEKEEWETVDEKTPPNTFFDNCKAGFAMG